MKIFSIVILVPLFIACSGKTEFDESGTSEELMENEIWNPIIILSREENKIVTAKSDKLYKKSNEMALLVGNVEANFFNEDGNHMSILYSDSARINEQSNNLHANGNVFVDSDSGYTLTTTDGDTLYGVGFESDMDLERWKISRPFGIARDGI